MKTNRLFCRKEKDIAAVGSLIGVMMGKLLGGAVLIEMIFTRPGLGRLVAESVASRNIPVIQGTVLVTATLFVLSNLLADISYMYIDPRIRYES